MGLKLLFTGLTFILALDHLGAGLPLALVGDVLMVIGLILLWLDR